MDQSVTDTLSLYMARCAHREATDDMLKRAVRWFVELHGDIEAVRVDYGRADDFRSWLLKGRSASSANTYLALVRAFFAWMAKRRIIEADPFDGVGPVPASHKVYPQYEPDQISRILTVADTRWRAIVALALCSMRQAEILNLVVSDIDFADLRILINPKKKTRHSWSWGIKDYQRAYIGIDEQIGCWLAELVEKLADGQPYVLLKKNYWLRNLSLDSAGRLSHRKRNCPWGNFDRDFKKLLRRANVPARRFHDLRGTFCSQRYKEGFGIKELQYLMRHSNIQTTARYIAAVDYKKLCERSARGLKNYYTTRVL